jgi:hypothetical protein
MHGVKEASQLALVVVPGIILTFRPYSFNLTLEQALFQGGICMVR